MKAVFFDLDGTLIDSRADLASAINLARGDFGLPELPRSQVVSYVGEGLHRLVARSMPELPGVLEEAVARTRVHYGAHLLVQTTLYPGVSEGVRRLGALGWKRAIVTNKPREFVRPVLVGGGDTAALKPDPAPILLAAGLLGVTDLRGSWMVGDHFTDLEAGRRTGLRRCFCRYGFGDPRGETFDLAVDSLVELARHVGSAKGEGLGAEGG